MYRYEFNEIKLDNSKNGLVLCKASVEARSLTEAKTMVANLLEVSIESLLKYDVCVLQLSAYEMLDEKEGWQE